MTDLDFTQEDKQSQYLESKGVYDLQVVEYKWSQDIEGYNKSPFVRFVVKDNVSNKQTSFTLWMPKDGESKQKSDIKKKIMKEYFENLGCNISANKGRDLLDCSIGKSCKVALKEVERVIYGSKDGKPIVVTDLNYWYSGASDKPLNANESKMFLPLNATQREKYDKDLSEWQSKNNQGSNNSPNFTSNFNQVEDDKKEVENEDWPF
tara:strand:- start:106 stop:726 length:621 start_codon:yes stop_codon:yes gene_type:complete